MLNLLLISAAVALTGACGDDDSESDTASDEAMDSGTGTPVDHADPDEVDPAPPADTTFECGATTCDIPVADTSGLPEELAGVVTPELISRFIMPVGCCTENDNPCGVEGGSGCLQQAQEGVEDEACPGVAVDVMGFAIDLGGCCKPDIGMCGFDFGVLGVGCLEREEAAMSSIMDMSLPDAGMIMSIGCGDGGDVDGGADVDVGI